MIPKAIDRLDEPFCFKEEKVNDLPVEFLSDYRRRIIRIGDQDYTSFQNLFKAKELKEDPAVFAVAANYLAAGFEYNVLPAPPPCIKDGSLNFYADKNFQTYKVECRPENIEYKINSKQGGSRLPAPKSPV